MRGTRGRISGWRCAWPAIFCLLGNWSVGLAQSTTSRVFDESLRRPESSAPLFDLRRAIVRAQDEDEPIRTDRPDFTETSSTVGRGVVQIEGGYTFIYDDAPDGTVTKAHSAPETLFRIGLCEWLEMRIAWNYAWERVDDGATITDDDGAEDLYFGAKIELAEQERLLPELAIILQGTAPTGAKAFSSAHTEYGLNLVYSWDLPNEWSIAGSTGFDSSTEHAGGVLLFPAVVPGAATDRHFVYHQSISLGVPLTDKLSMYIEYFGLYTYGRDSDFPENYTDGGFTYLVTNNFQLDVRAGVGLNENANDFFTGAGAGVRF